MKLSKNHEKTHEIAVKKAESHGIAINAKGGYVRHVLLCVGSSCGSAAQCSSLWKQLNKRLKKAEKDGTYVYRSKVECLNLCKAGPLMVVYPEGTWYHSVSDEVLDAIIDEHLLGGTIVKDYAFAHNPLSAHD